jgi:ribosomal protein S18 acetylase RimI-like enzyme
MPENVILDYCNKDDLKVVADCHREAFPESFSTKLGQAYLIKNYEWYLISNRRFLIKASIGGKVVGFVGGMLIDKSSTMGSTSSVMQYTFKQALVGLMIHPWLIFNVEVRKNIVLIARNIARKVGLSGKPRGTHAVVSNPLDVVPSLGLVVIGNTPLYRGKGVGAKLLARFEVEANRIEVNQMHLSVRKKNLNAIKAYTRGGWLIKKEVGDNLEMIKVLK